MNKFTFIIEDKICIKQHFHLLFCMAEKSGLLLLKWECEQQVFGSEGPQRIFGPKRHEVKGDWRKLNNEEHRDQYNYGGEISVLTVDLKHCLNGGNNTRLQVFGNLSLRSKRMRWDSNFNL